METARHPGRAGLLHLPATDCSRMRFRTAVGHLMAMREQSDATVKYPMKICDGGCVVVEVARQWKVVVGRIVTLRRREGLNLTEETVHLP